ncbi:MAG: homoserine O-acetyltransferase [Acidobacteriota bacterium]
MDAQRERSRLVLPKELRVRETLRLDCGRALTEFTIAYETYGELDSGRTNAIFLFHTLSSTHHAAGRHAPGDPKPGWWDAVIGPGKTLDTDRYCIISSNVLGGCAGSTGPGSTNPETGRPYGSRFPAITVGDIVRAQHCLVTALGIRRLHAVMGGCFGGFQALEWMVRYPQMVDRAVLIGTSTRASAHTIARNAVVREAIIMDARWDNGDYYEHEPPLRGMGLAAMIGMLIWMDRGVMESRFGRRRQAHGGYAYGYAPEFDVELFLKNVAEGAMGSMDPNSLLCLTRSMDYFDLESKGSSLPEVFRPVQATTLVISYDSDWRYPPAEGATMVDALKLCDVEARHVVLHSRFGHGAFLQEPRSLIEPVSEFLDARQP